MWEGLQVMGLAVFKVLGIERGLWHWRRRNKLGVRAHVRKLKHPNIKILSEYCSLYFPIPNFIQNLHVAWNLKHTFDKTSWFCASCVENTCGNYLQCRLVSSYQLNAHFLYSIPIYMLHYDPQHVSSTTLLIFRRTDCIITASGIVTLCKRPYSMQVESGLQSMLWCTVRNTSDYLQSVVIVTGYCSILQQ